MNQEEAPPKFLDQLVSWKGLQVGAIIVYGGLTVFLTVEGFCTGTWSPVLVVSAFSLLVMIARTIWTAHKGLWGSKYSMAIQKKHLTLWAPAFLPERTAAVAIILIAYLAILRPDGGNVVSTVFGLLITGGLVAAVITSPHTIIDLIDTLDQAQEEERNWHRPTR